MPDLDTPLSVMPPAELDRLRDMAAEHHPAVLGIFVLHGSQELGVSVSAWTVLEDESGMQTFGILEYAMKEGGQISG